MIAITVVLAVLALVCIGAAVWFTVANAGVAPDSPDRMPRSRPLVLAGLFFAAASILSTGFHIIEAGHVGVVTWFGQVEHRTLQPGAQFVVPVAESIVVVETRVHGIHFEGIGAASLEYQDVLLSGTLNIHVDSTGVEDLYQRVGLDYADKLVNPFFNDIIKEVVPTYRIGDILANRSNIRSQTVALLNTKLSPYHIIVDDVAIANIAFSEAYTHAIEEKQVQEQRVLTERQILAQRTIQADQAVAQAKGEADAEIERARGTAEANRQLAESLSPILIQWQAIQRLQDNIKIMLVPSDGNFILDLNNLEQTP